MKLTRILALIATAILFCARLTLAQPTLIAAGQLSGSGGDHAGQTHKPLENGVPGNQLGGLGSGIAHAGGDRFVALPDRGPNAVTYDDCVDSTASYINRFHELRLRLQPSSGPGLPFELTPFLDTTKLLSSSTPLEYGDGTMCPVPPAGPLPAPLPDGAPALNNRNTFYFTGRSDNFGGGDSLNPANARLDTESIRVANDGNSVYISDEYGPYVYQFDRNTGTRLRAFTLPGKFAVTTLSSQGAVEIAWANVHGGRIANKGMEGLAITPDGSTLVGIMQSALGQDGGDAKGQVNRLVVIDIATGNIVHEYAYPTDTKTKTTVSDIVAVNNHVLLVDERDGSGLGFPRDGSAAAFKKLYLIDIDDPTGTHDVSNVTGKANLAAKALKKYLFLDVLAGLESGLGLDPTQVPAKLEGIAFGDDVVVGGVSKHTLYVSNDNDFDPSAENPNRFFVFAFSDDDLANAPASDASTLGSVKAQFVPQIVENK
jgi:hypothetical protein